MKTLLVSVFCLFISQSVFATRFVTTLDFETPYTGTSDHFDQLIVEWATDLVSGEVRDYDLTNLTFKAYVGGVLMFQDDAIINGVLQSVGGIRTTFDDTHWLSDSTLSAPSLTYFDNLVFAFLVPGVLDPDFYNFFYGTSGYPDYPDLMGVWQVNDGNTAQYIFMDSNITRAVPEPSLFALMGLGLLGLFGVNRRKARH